MGIISSINKARNIDDEKARVLPYISLFVKRERVKLGLMQVDFAKKVGIGLRLLRKIEQGDLNVNFVKLNYLLNCLGYYLKPSELVVSPVKKKGVLLSKENVLNILKNIYPIFEVKYDVRKLALFGSYAKNCQSEDSDIDILISFRNKVSLEIEGEIQLILENLFGGIKVDLVLEENIHQTLKDEIMETKIEIY